MRRRQHAGRLIVVSQFKSITDSMRSQIDKAAVLLEALPYIQNFRGQTFLIKVGGSAMEDPSLVRGLLRDIVFLEAVGVNPVLVHGGGKAISQAMKGEGLQARFCGGLRITDEDTIRIVERTLNEVINPALVEQINTLGGHAVGLSGKRVLVGRRTTGTDPRTGEATDLGYVGQVTGFETSPVIDAIAAEKVPVISPIAVEADSGRTLNVNADLAASALAGRLKVSKLVYLSDVLGVMRDPLDASTLMQTLRPAEIETLIGQEVINGGMIPKVRSALEALRQGVGKVHLIDGRIKHSLILEIFTDRGIGTEIVLQ